MGSLEVWGHLVSERFKMLYIRRKWKLILGAAVIVAAGCIGPGQRLARAQNSVAGWPEQKFTVLKPQVARFETRNTVYQSLKSGTFAAPTDEQVFADYYDKSVFPNVTNPASRESPKDDVIIKLRSDLKQAAGEKPKEGETPKAQMVFDKLADLIMTFMTKIASDSQYHPAARVNAMLAIGEVNSPKAAKLLLDTAFGRGQIFAIRVAAMTGLVRMAGPSGKGLLSDPEIEPLVVKSMVAFARYHPRKPDDGIAWMRGQAADVLADLGNPEGGIPSALLTMLNDKELPIPLRSRAARALGKLKYGDSLPAGDPYLKALAELAGDALSSDQPADRARVRLVARDVLDGLKQFAKSSTDQALIGGLQKTLDTLRQETADKMTDAELKAAIDKAKESLDGLVKK